MALETVSVAAAVAVVDYDLLNNSSLRQSKQKRTLAGVALAGSGAALDTIVDVFAGIRFVARVYNLATGAPTHDHLFPVMEAIGPDEELKAIVRDAAVTNPLTLVLDLR